MKNVTYLPKRVENRSAKKNTYTSRRMDVKEQATSHSIQKNTARE